MRLMVSKDFMITPTKVLELNIEEVLYHLCYTIDKMNFENYLKDKNKQNI